MIILSASKTTGKEAHKIIMSAIKKRQAALANGSNQKVTREDFCRASGLTRMTIGRYRDNKPVSPEGIFKIAAGLKEWGFEVKIDV